MMRYTLITKNGRVMVFYVKAVAELYQAINGGVICNGETADERCIHSNDQLARVA